MKRKYIITSRKFKEQPSSLPGVPKPPLKNSFWILYFCSSPLAGLNCAGLQEVQVTSGLLASALLSPQKPSWSDCCLLTAVSSCLSAPKAASSQCFLFSIHFVRLNTFTYFMKGRRLVGAAALRMIYTNDLMISISLGNGWRAVSSSLLLFIRCVGENFTKP